MSDYLDPGNEELLKDFFSEAQGQVDLLEQNILALENGGGGRDAVDEIFRAAHTLKGGAATVEMDELAHFTHLVEDVLDAVRSDQAAVTEETVDALLAAEDVIKAMLERRMEGEVYKGDTSGIEARLRDLLPENSGQGASRNAGARTGAGGKGLSRKAAPQAPAQEAPPARAEAPAPGKALSEYELLELKDAVNGETPVYHITVHFDESGLMNTVGGIQIYAALKSIGVVLRTQPDFEQLYEDTFFPTVEYYAATERPPEEIRQYVLIPDVTLSADIEDITALLTPPDFAAQALKGTYSDSAIPEAGAPWEAEAPLPVQEDAPEAAPEAALEAAPEAAHETGAKETGASRKAGAGSILRVDSKRIDGLLNLVSETVITKATFNQINNQFTAMTTDLRALESIYREKVKGLLDRLPACVESIQGGKPIKEVHKELIDEYGGLLSMFDGFEAGLKSTVGKFRATSQNLGRITGELQEGVMRIRMVPISQIFSRFPRLVRDLSKSLNKKINLVIEGEETELDKSVIEDLLDPIMHSVRNSADHGIEDPAERKAAGKSEEGTIILKASNEGSMIVIEITDDGRGIDVEAVRRKAAERGLISASKALTDSEAFNLIFEPGFSTAKAVTNVSGRGVGLDVVRRQIDKLNGTVRVTSEKGTGTAFTITLPLTLAIIQGLLVRVGPEVYSIPITSVIESLRIKHEDIKLIDNYEVFNLRDEVISLLRLNRLFGIKTEETRDYSFIVIVGSAEKKMGFMVDSLIGEEDVVIKPLGDQFTNSPGIAGASILGDGSVSLIIDVSQLLELGLRKEREQRRLREASGF